MGLFNLNKKEQKIQESKPVEPDTTLLEVEDIVKSKSLYPRMRPLVYNFLIDCQKAGLKGGIFSSIRTFAEQDALYAQGRTKPGAIVTNAKGGQSYHNFSVAFDFVFKNNNNWTWNGDWSSLGKIGAKNGLEWGGSWASFPDRPHFQKLFKPLKLSDSQWMSQLKIEFLKNNKIEDVWAYIDKNGYFG